MYNDEDLQEYSSEEEEKEDEFAIPSGPKAKEIKSVDFNAIDKIEVCRAVASREGVYGRLVCSGESVRAGWDRVARSWCASRSYEARWVSIGV